MEAVLLSSPTDQSISPYKHNRKNSQKYSFSSRSTENFAHPNVIHNHQSIIHGGMLLGPVYSSVPSGFSVSNHRQPPLLPLPISRTYSSLPIRNNSVRNISTSPPNKKFNRSKSKSPKKQDSSKAKPEISVILSSSSNRLGPEPSDLPKEVGSRVLKPGSAVTVTEVVVEEEEGGMKEEICGSIFSLAPPPSSLPLPRFSMKPKVGCNLEAGGIDTGATDGLRRLLRLH